MDKDKLDQNKKFLKARIESDPIWIRGFLEAYDRHLDKIENELRQAERDSDFNRIKYMIGLLDGVHSVIGLAEGIRLREEAKRKAESSPPPQGLLGRSLALIRGK